MTTETDLLPLPEGDAAWYYIGSTHVYSADEMESYARANVAHATAAKDAEIEALRAEVERWKIAGREWLDKTEWVQQTVKPRELGHHRADILRQRIERAEARAERLAEALRVAEAALSDIGDADREEGDDLAWCERRAAEPLPMIRALLRDQEEGK